MNIIVPEDLTRLNVSRIELVDCELTEHSVFPDLNYLFESAMGWPHRRRLDREVDLVIRFKLKCSDVDKPRPLLLAIVDLLTSAQRWGEWRQNSGA